MIFIHGHTAKPAPPEMAGPLQAGMGAMHFDQSAPYATPVARRRDLVDVICHQHPGPDAHFRRLAMPGQQGPIEVIVEVTEKYLCTPVTALRDTVGNAGDDGAPQTSHGPSLELAKYSIN